MFPDYNFKKNILNFREYKYLLDSFLIIIKN